MTITENLVKHILAQGGSIKPLLVPHEFTGGTGLMNPSVYNDNGKIVVIIRHVNYTFFHSEQKKFQHQWGPLTYVHPEDDMHLRTRNFYAELDHNLQIKFVTEIDSTQFDTYEPQWTFVGLEDARIFRWEDKLYISGVRRDTTTNGQGRMELSEIKVTGQSVQEISRVRIQPPVDPTSYCEKNWMPVLDTPYHYVKWSDPTEVVKVNVADGSSEQVTLTQYRGGHSDFRGGTQVLPYGDGHIALVHEVDLFNSEVGRKDGVYRHRFVVWDANWNLIKWSPEFTFMNAHVEFAVGMCQDPHNQDCWLISFGVQDNAAFVLRTPKQTIETFIEA